MRYFVTLAGLTFMLATVFDIPAYGTYVGGFLLLVGGMLGRP